MAILSIDFLRTHSLMVDLANCRLVQASGCVFPAMAVTSSPTTSVITGDKLLLKRYVVNPSKVLPQMSHGVEHHLETRGPPITSAFRWLDTQKLAAAKAEFAAVEQDGIIWGSSSPWASFLHMVEKPDGSWHCCDDYHRLNNTFPNTYPLPNMMDFSSGVAGCSIFSKINLY